MQRSPLVHACTEKTLATFIVRTHVSLRIHGASFRDIPFRNPLQLKNLKMPELLWRFTNWYFEFISLCGIKYIKYDLLSLT